MRDVPVLIATGDQAAGVATVTVRGEFRPSPVPGRGTAWGG